VDASEKSERADSFEESLRRLEEIVVALERGEAPLEQGLGLFEEGVALSRKCHAMLAEAEERVARLVKRDEGFFHLEVLDASGTDAAKDS
jgi:exodeoxyribonuclease VII small subunit